MCETLVNNNDEPDLVTQYYDGTTSKIGILFDFFENQNNLYYINLTNYADYISKGDINGDGFIDIVFAFNVEKQLGVSYNSGTGNFSEPDYYDTELYPNDIAVGDIDGNGRDDIAIAGSNTEIYYSFETGFELFNFTGYEYNIELYDMDKDGDTDVITGWGAGVTSYLIYENLGYQNFQQHTIYTFQSASGGLRVHDLNNDSLPEITFMAGVKCYILFNNGNFNFSEPDTILPNFSSPYTYCWADVDSNSYKDIIIIRNLYEYFPNLKILFNDGNGNFVENPITSETDETITNNSQFYSCFPNPFLSEINIKFYINESSFIEISIFNLKGELIKVIAHQQDKGGNHFKKWDGLDNSGKICKPGTYLLSLKVNGNVLQTIKIIKY